MKFALKTADNIGLYLKNGQPVFVEDPSRPAEFWPVNEAVAEDFVQTGWELVNGVCKAKTIPNPVSKRERLAQALKARSQFKEFSAPVELGGMTFRRDADFRMRLIEAVAFSSAGETISFRDSTGIIRKITRENLILLARKAAAFAEQVAVREDQLAKALAAASDAELPAIKQTIEDFVVTP